LPTAWSSEEQQLLEQLRVQRSANPRHDWLRSAAL
jgi:curved DNA-binding protein